MNKECEEQIVVYVFDGYNVGFASDFANTFFEFEDEQEAMDIANHWVNWCNGMDV